MFNNILITGANFENKGAQSMLFITMHELRKRNPQISIYFASEDMQEFPSYRFTKVYASQDAKSIALQRNKTFVILKRSMKDFAKFIIGRRDNLWKCKDLVRIMPNIDLIIDVSGFNLGKKWDIATQESYLDNIRLAKAFNIPIILMPQSFGPFDYPQSKEHLLKEIAEELPYCSMIFARENEGFLMLERDFHLSNIRHSPDLVLQNRGIDLNNVFNKAPEIIVPQIPRGAVGIVPNMQCFTHGNETKNLKIYRNVIKKLLEKEKNVYIFRHSSEDLEICKKIRDISGNNVHIIENDFSCIEYDEFVKQFEFIICSRYHGAVHAYRNGIPSILLGWATKYDELAQLLGQDKYSFDITDDNLKVTNIVTAVEEMCDNYHNQSLRIKKYLREINRENCFDVALK